VPSRNLSSGLYGCSIPQIDSANHLQSICLIRARYGKKDPEHRVHPVTRLTPRFNSLPTCLLKVTCATNCSDTFAGMSYHCTWAACQFLLS